MQMEGEKLNILGSVYMDSLKSEQVTGMTEYTVGHDFQQGKICLTLFGINPFYTFHF